MMEQEIGIWDSVLLENLSEDNFISNIHQRYKRNHIYTYIGTSVVAVNPYHHISEHSLDNIHSYGSKEIFQLPPHIYGLTNLAFQSLKDQNDDQCILLTGESGAGKTETFKMIVNFPTHIQDQPSSQRRLQKQSSVSSTTSAAASASATTSATRQHRRTSSNCSATNFVICKNPSSNNASASAALRRQSPSPAAAARRYGGSDMVTQPQCMRAESTDRHVTIA